MFKRIQHQLLLRHPLLWNLKIVPLMAVMLALHIIFFIIGYVHGGIDFTDAGIDDFYDATPAIVIFFSIFTSLLVLILWLVYYFRNNAFKSFYPLNRLSLYKEFLLLFIICIINCSYIFSFIYAGEWRQRNYYSEEEFLRRTDIISMASLFADGGFREGPVTTKVVNGEVVRIERSTFMYNGREYSLKSLMNKTLTDFPYKTREKDSLNEARVKRWLMENRKDSVLWVMREFDKIAKEHHVKSNITPEKWLDLVYDYPDYTNYITVGRIESYPEGSNPIPYNYNEEAQYGDTVMVETQAAYPQQANIDTMSNYIKIINGRSYVYPKYYVPLKQLEVPYEKIGSAYSNPGADSGLALFFAYFGLMLSLAIFSFRVTSGKSWLIALVAFGVTMLITGILNVIFSMVFSYGSSLHILAELFYVIIWLLIGAGLLAYFFSSRISKGISGILLNICLWITPWILPALSHVILEIMESGSTYANGKRFPPKSGFEQWMDSHEKLFMLLCAITFVLFMYFFTVVIKRWKGVAEA